MAIEALIDLLGPYAKLLLPGLYVAFFLGTLGLLGVAQLRPRFARPARRLWLLGFFSGLAVTTAIGAPILPFVDMNKYSEPSDETFTYHQIRIADGDGNEIEYDSRAAPPVKGNSRESRLAAKLLRSYSDAERLEMARFLLESARDYRERVESGDTSPLEDLQPPRYVDDQAWTAGELEGFSTFESIRVYRGEMVYEADDTGIESHDRELRLVIDVEDEQIEERGAD